MASNQEVQLERIASLPTGLDFTNNAEGRKKRIKMLAENVYKPRNRRERLIARATVRRALKKVKI